MPYSKAHYYLLALLAITIIAFWPSYFGQLQKAPMAHHLHGITATLWIVLLAIQNWLIHNNRKALHKSLGKIMFVLVPLMIASFALVTWLGAQKTVGGHPFYLQFGQALITADAMLVLTTPLQIYLALLYRKKVHLHSALMLSTLVGLLPPVLSRLFVNLIPSWNITGLETMYRFGYGLHSALIFTIVLAFVLYLVYRRQGWPWLLAVIIAILMYFLYLTLGQSAVWSQWVKLMAEINPIVVFIFGLLMGALACLLGWFRGVAAKQHK